MVGQEEKYAVETPCEVEREASTSSVYQNGINNSQHIKWALHDTYQDPLGVRSWTWTQAHRKYVGSH